MVLPPWQPLPGRSTSISELHSSRGMNCIEGSVSVTKVDYSAEIEKISATSDRSGAVEIDKCKTLNS
jgi:hypothetical protein